ncbi:DUF2142 domain-containing protein [Leifsonia soli]|uniref:DUF2142 domain-containing protein n=1 Tax=Leifsonia soli TaxID=582665 RepID=A0A852SUA0_9MICO|nr:DUF2142 domain-containing protein [Leifsonia soli]NYD72628.1 hypothetical protein [Leifsonia soli]
MAESPTRRRFIPTITGNRWGVFGLGFVLTLLPMLLWNLASPIGSSPDEPTHLVRAAAVARGQVFTQPWDGNRRMSEAKVPEYVDTWILGVSCYAFRPNVPASCVPPITGDPDRIVETGHTAAANSPVFYAVTGLPSLFLDGSKALYAMRGMNSLMCATMFGFIFMALSQLARPRWAYFAAFVAATPMVFYLGGTLNPNGIEAISAGALLSGLVVVGSRMIRGARLIELLGGIVLSTVLLTATRNISLLWVLMVVVTALLLSRRAILKRLVRLPSVWVAIGLAALACILEFLYYIHPSLTAQPQQFNGAGTTFRDGFTYMIQHTFDYGIGWIGFFGWVDTPAPSFTLIVWASLMLGTVVAALAIGIGARRWSLILLVAALVLVPAIAQAAVITRAGFIWQGRYTLAIVITLLLAAGIVLDRSGYGIPAVPLRRVATMAVWFMAFGHFFAFAVTIKRYVVGDAVYLPVLLLHPKWQPPGTWIVLCAAFIVVIVGASIVAVKALKGVDRRFLPQTVALSR